MPSNNLEEIKKNFKVIINYIELGSFNDTMNDFEDK